MMTINNIFSQTARIIYIILSLLCVLCLNANFSYANTPAFNGVSCGYNSNKIDTTFEIFDYDTDYQKESKQKAKQALTNINNYCQQLKKQFPQNEDSIERDTGFIFGWGGDSEQEFKKKFDSFMNDHPEVKEKYNQLLDEFNQAKKEYDEAEQKNRDDINEGIASGKYIPCGEKHPRGCAQGQSCYRSDTTQAAVSSTGSTPGQVHLITKYECFVPGKEGSDWYLAKDGSGTSGMQHTMITTGYKQTTTYNTDGTTEFSESVLGQKVPQNSYDKISNEACRVADMEKKYKSSCYSCIVIKTLLEKFIAACSKVNDLCREAAVQVLLIATLIWLAFWGLRTLSSFSSLEPASLVNTLLVQAFKIMVAYVIIQSGVDVFIIYVITPILTAGADFGTALLNSINDIISMTPSPDYTYSGVEYFSADMLNKIMGFTESLDRVASDNLVIGHALTCHSTHAGAWTNITILGYHIVLPNFWIWLCGAAIWFAGFMLVLSVGYYLLDISFKIGLAILAFPIVMALWPFSVTSGKVKVCIKTMLTSAATFAFLAITTSYGMLMISTALRDITLLKEKIEQGDTQWVSDTFDITGPYFFLILFAYLYSLKLISSTISNYVNKFFGGGLLASASPMHSEMTRMTDIAKKITVGGAKTVGGAVTNVAGKAINKTADATLGRAVRFVKSKFHKKK